MTRIGLVHVKYHQRGGEDVHVEGLRRLYSEMGLGVADLPLSSVPLWRKAARSLTEGSERDWDEWVSLENPDLLHLHNIHPDLGPAFLRWLHKRKIPAMATIHNHRFYCTNGLALYGSKPCKACLHSSVTWRPLIKNCNGSYSRSVYHALALTQIRQAKLLEKSVKVFLAPTPYMADEMVRAGFSRDKILVFPHFVETPDATSEKEKDIDVIYAGRLSEEKGIRALAATARLLPHLRFSFVGDGPLQSFLEEERERARNITVHPKCSREELHRLVARARVACAPSLCEESFSLFSVESIIQGLNLVVANNDSMAWLTRPPFTGIPAEVRAPRALASALEVALAKAQSAPPQEIRQYFSPEKYKKTLATILRDKFGSGASA